MGQGNGSPRRPESHQRHVEIERAIAVQQARNLLNICTDCSPIEAFQLLLGACFMAGSEYEREQIEATVREAVKRHLSDGFHIEAASVLVSNVMKTDALEVIEVGLQVHTDEESPSELKIIRRLKALKKEAEKLPSR